MDFPTSCRNNRASGTYDPDLLVTCYHNLQPNMTFQSRSEADHKASLSVAIAPSANGRHLVRHVSPDQPYFHLGDTTWELLHRLSHSEAEHFLRNRAAKGFTGTMVTLLAEHG